MSDESNSPLDVRFQLARYVESLRAAGIEWVPAPPKNPSAGASLGLPMVQAGLPAAPLDATAAANMEERQRQLAALRQQVAKCTRCTELASTRSKTVFGEGPLDPDLCFVGEAPGRDEDFQGMPFVGAAGQLLTRIITACGMKREEVFICNVLRCRPPNNRQPLPEEAEHCREWLEKTLELVRPKFLCTLGAIPTRYLLGLSAGITRTRGKFYEYRGIPVMVTFHPSYLLRVPEKKKEVWEDMKALLKRMGKAIPGQSE